jgi:hypothetical protein
MTKHLAIQSLIQLPLKLEKPPNWMHIWFLLHISTYLMLSMVMLELSMVDAGRLYNEMIFKANGNLQTKGRECLDLSSFPSTVGLYAAASLQASEPTSLLHGSGVLPLACHHRHRYHREDKNRVALGRKETFFLWSLRLLIRFRLPASCRRCCVHLQSRRLEHARRHLSTAWHLLRLVRKFRSCITRAARYSETSFHFAPA